MAKYIKYGHLGDVVSKLNEYLLEDFEIGMGDTGELSDELENIPDEQNWLEIPAEASKTGEAVRVEFNIDWFE